MSLNEEKLNNFINGNFCEPEQKVYIDKINPSNSQFDFFIPRSNLQDVQNAVEAAQKVQKKWQLTTFQQRSQLLFQIADELEKQIEKFAQLESRDTGKPIGVSSTVDIPRAIHNFRFFAGIINYDSTGCHLMADAINYTVRKPLGIVGLITPWNLPLYLLTWKIAPALIMGNCIIAKPSEFTPSTATALCEIFNKVGLPAGVFNLVHGLGNEVGAAIVSHPKISCISFTGGTATGEIIARQAAPMFKKMSLELGGKNAGIFFEDIDIEKNIATIARSGFLNSGQICLCLSRMLVHRSIFSNFVDALTKEAAKWKIGSPNVEGVRMGPLISEQHYKKVLSYIELAKSEGGQVVFGGQIPEDLKDSKGYFLQPTIITNLEINSRTATEEIFGPVVTIHPFDTAEQAVEMANSVKYGLAGSVWTKDVQKAHRISGALDVGMVWVNCWLHRDLRVPFGGMKASGVGREGGFNSLEFFSETMNICIHTDLPNEFY
eukprot:TRINITY_DN82_c5_g1_i1.p1 TRINITY_DN82_c5_g1~~TRINITY_DN82_c5_g1_i1.p1  ORF type:complete len:490 (-),score=227.04 TRINITY_DN82_c5_g1_i1:50-1519(-)